MNANEQWDKELQQKKCKLYCGKPALQGWRYANMCRECYDEHSRAMINLCSLNGGVLQMGYISICESCWAHIENNSRTVFWIDKNACCNDKECEVYMTGYGGINE